MLIRHDPHLSRSRFLMPVPVREWREPSRFVPRDEFGNHTTRTRFRIRARLSDGHVAWTGWFSDREDFDAFLWAIACNTLRYERELWRLPTPAWHPDIGENVTFDFATQTILTTTGSNQTYTSPSDWNNSNNTVECLGGGGSGASRSRSTGHETGGGAGAYSAITNFSFASPGTTTATYRVGSGGAAVVITGAGNSAGNSGTATWFNDTVDPGNGTTNAKCSAAAGLAGANGTGSQNGGVGGATTSSWGQTKYAGGRGGNLTGASGAGGSGGGGAAGPAGAGGNGGDSSSTAATSTNGGSANNGTTAGGVAPDPGVAGTEFSASYGCGSGGGGRSAGFSSAASSAGDGGNYGAGGGGISHTNASAVSATSGAGKQGLVIVTYTPTGGGIIWDPGFQYQHILVR